MVEGTAGECAVDTTKDGDQRMDVWMGSELGMVKSCRLDTDVFHNHAKFQGISKSHGVTSMAWHGADEQQMLLGRHNGTVQCFHVDSRTLVDHPHPCAVDSRVVGVASLDNGSLAAAASETGMLKVWTGGLTGETVNRQIGDNIRCLAGSPCGKLLAAGGKENNLKVWDVARAAEDKLPRFAAKNVRNDFLDLRVPVHVTCAQFMRSSSEKLVSGTNFHQVRVYDTKTQKRPVIDFEWHEHPITSIAVHPDETRLLCANSAGYLAALDLRMNGRVVAGFKGSSGSTRAVLCHGSQPIVAACGLDRFLRVYNLDTRRCIKKIYMKSAMSCMLFSDAELSMDEAHMGGRLAGEKRSATEVKKEEEVEDAEVEDVWESMRTVGETNKKKKKKLNNNRSEISGEIVKIEDEG